jgi:alpha-L-fucosidase
LFSTALAAADSITGNPIEERDVNRREFMKTVGAGALGMGLAGCAAGRREDAIPVPSYLKGYEDHFRKDPREAARRWFREARFGLFMHYGLYSLLGRHEWVQYREKIPLDEYTRLKDDFTAARFDADFITDLACEAGMKYVNITSRHHEGFSLFATGQNDYNAKAAPAKRDLIAELAGACDRKGLGLFLYYSYAADWWHPYFYPRSAGWACARPAYDFDEPRYRWTRDEDFRIYVEYVHAQLRELLTGYGPLAGIWFDPIMGYYARPDLFPVEETYALVRSLQPQVLISFKQGALGTEDFAAPERSGHSLKVRVEEMFPGNEEVAGRAWEGNRAKHNEICDTLQPHGWGYIAADDGKHKSADRVMEMLASAGEQGCNLLLNTGPLPDGSIHAEDAATLLELGKRLR